jgi:secreted trypsin-like serine protease
MKMRYPNDMFQKAKWVGAVAALTVAAVLPAAAQPPAAESNPMREKVLAWQAQQLANATGSVVQLDDGSSTEIVGGKPAPDGRWPFMVALLSADVGNNFNAQFCGGSLIDAEHVLTAAHCVEGNSAASIEVLVGTQSLAQGGRRVAVERVTTHPKFQSVGGGWDVAVLRLTTPVTDIEPVAYMRTKSEESTYAPPGTLTTGTGWGARSASGGSFPEELYKVRVPIVSRAECNGSNSYDGDITSTMICAGLLGEGGKDTCGGDSGGPLITRDANGESNLQVGITSWGFGCAQAKYPGVYSRLAVLGDWVAQQVAAP